MNMREIVNTLPESERVLNCLTEVEHSTQGKTIINNSEARFKDLVNIVETVNMPRHLRVGLYEY